MSSGLQKPTAPTNTQAADAMKKAGLGQQTTQQQPKRVEAAGVMGLNTRMKSPMARSSSSEQVQKFETAIKNVMETSITESMLSDFTVLVMDNNRHQIAFSTLLLVYKKEGKLAVYSYIIENSNTKLANRYDSIGGQQVEIEIVTGDVYNQKSYWDQVTQVVMSHTGASYENITDAGCMVIDSDLDMTDTTRLWNVVFNGVSATFTIIANVLGKEIETFTVQQIGQNDQLVAVLDFSGDESETVTGLPVRSDIKLSLKGTVNVPNNEVGVQQQRDITQVCGYLDLIFERPPQNQPYGMMQQPSLLSYYPRFVITKMASMLDGESLEIQLLALSTSILLSNNMSWMGAFKPRYLENDLRDIGAIGYEVNLSSDPNQKPERVNTKSDTFDTNKLQTLIVNTIRPDLIYSMDIEEVGELSWIHQAFLSAAFNDEDSIAAIVAAANNLTNGQFSRFWDGTQKICEYDDNRIHLGYFVGDKGEKNDIREIDYLAVLNLVGKSNIQMVEEWESTFTQKNQDLSIRLDRRRKMLAALFSGKMEVKGFARRINFNPNFITALSQANQAANLVIRPGNTLQEFGAQHIRGNSGYSNFAVNAQNLGNVFNNNVGVTNTNRWNQPSVSRTSWGK